MSKAREPLKPMTDDRALTGIQAQIARTSQMVSGSRIASMHILIVAFLRLKM